jgi:hypothetical protein
MMTLDVRDRDGFTIGRSATVSLDGRQRTVHWRNDHTMIIDDERYDITSVIGQDGVLSFGLIKRPRARRSKAEHQARKFRDT